MNLREDKFDVGVIVGRFQVKKLHEAHKEVIRSVSERHKKVIVFLGVPPTLGTRKNPLDFQSRKLMVESDFPNVIVLPAYDHSDDQIWSKNLDKSISGVIPATQKVVLYGGRDSFKPHYHGRYKVLEFESEGYFSGTESRKEASVECLNSDDFRAGVISGIYNQFPKVYTTVDMAIFDKEKILLGKKEGENAFRLIGGFSEPDSDSFEADILREVQEETGLEVSHPIYIGSKKIEDWRYRGEVDKIKTLLFISDYVFGAPEGKDDLPYVEWRDFNSLKETDFLDCHKPLFVILKNHPEVQKRVQGAT